MVIKEVFENLYIEFGVGMEGFWNDEFLVSHADLMDVIESKLEMSSYVGTDAFEEMGKKILVAITNSKAKVSEEEVLLLDFMQFYYCGAAAQYLSRKGIFPQTHNWLVWSLSDEIEYGSEVDFQLQRLGVFESSKVKIIIQNIPTAYFVWMSTLFYYSRSFGGLKGLSQSMLDQDYIRLQNFARVSGMGYDEGEPLNLLCQVLAWCITNDRDDYGRTFAYAIEQWIPKLQPINQKLAYLQLATGGAQYTDHTSWYYAEKVFTDYKDLCSHHEMLHAQSIYYTHHLQDLEADPTLMHASFDAYSSSLSGISAISKIYEKGRIFGVIRGLVMSCLKNAKAALAFDLIVQFYEKGDDYKNQLFIALNIAKQNVSFVSDGVIISGEGINHDAYREMVVIENKFFGTKTMLRDDPSFMLEEPKNLGHPDKTIGLNFEKVLSKYYCFNQLKDLNINFDSLIIIPGPQHPIQSLMIKEVGYAAPINSSFQIPNPQRDILKVLLWCYGTLSSDRELNMVSQIFTAARIEVEQVDILNETKASFIEKYADSSYDVVWIATHGNYDHQLPHKSTLGILPDVEISIEEISLIPLRHEGQRLLLLNVCDGATSSTNDTMYGHGFGAGLAVPSQCVISHLWPVETEPALFYGLVYAHLLCSTGNFWEAYEKCVMLLASEGKVFLSSLQGSYEAIDFSEIETRLTEEINSNIYYWGSSVFYV